MCAILQNIYFDKNSITGKKINLWLGVSYLLSEVLGGLGARKDVGKEKVILSLGPKSPEETAILKMSLRADM